MEKSTKETRLEVPAKTEELDLVIDFISRFLLQNGFDQKSVMQTSIAAEEIFTNICRYAYAPESGSVRLDLSMDTRKETATVRFSDCGRTFDPLAAAPPDITLPADRRTEGGLGIFMAQKLVSRIEYHNEDGMNILTITKQKTTEESLYGNHPE